jgi:hypothetical protein
MNHPNCTLLSSRSLLTFLSCPLLAAGQVSQEHAAEPGLLFLMASNGLEQPYSPVYIPFFLFCGTIALALRYSDVVIAHMQGGERSESNTSGLQCLQSTSRIQRIFQRGKI